jgi:NADH-quinone oxidoreductase subunit L
VGAFASGIFHLMTHAFFKALLFMAAGSVMHALSGELDMRYMGDLKKKLPRTHWTYVFGTLAIAGIIPFAGFFSKDEILFYSFERNVGFWIIGALAAIMTSFYMFRSVFMTFYGESRVTPHAAKHLHESPAIMTVPLMILAALSLIGGWVGIPIFHGLNRFGDFIAPVFAPAQAIITGGHAAGHHNVSLELILMGVSLLIGITGWVVAWWVYTKDTSIPDKAIEEFKGLHTLVYNKYWMDEIYDFLFVNSIVDFSRFLWKKFDELIVDGIVNGVASLTLAFGRGLRLFQTGLVKDYALSILVGVLAVIGYLVLR